MVRRRSPTSETNPKSEYRNPKQTQIQINLKSGKSKTPNPKEACLEFYIFWSFEIVSNFGFRASNFLFLASLRPFDVTQGMLCASHAVSDACSDDQQSKTCLEPCRRVQNLNWNREVNLGVPHHRKSAAPHRGRRESYRSN